MACARYCCECQLYDHAKWPRRCHVPANLYRHFRPACACLADNGQGLRSQAAACLLLRLIPRWTSHGTKRLRTPSHSHAVEPTFLVILATWLQWHRLPPKLTVGWHSQSEMAMGHAVWHCWAV